MKAAKRQRRWNYIGLLDQKTFRTEWKDDAGAERARPVRQDVDDTLYQTRKI